MLNLGACDLKTGTWYLEMSHDKHPENPCKLSGDKAGADQNVCGSGTVLAIELTVHIVEYNAVS